MNDVAVFSMRLARLLAALAVVAILTGGAAAASGSANPTGQPKPAGSQDVLPPAFSEGFTLPAPEAVALEPEIVPSLGDPKVAPSVNVMPGKFVGRGEPYTWVGRILTIWGNVKNGAPPLTFEWQFGDGSAPVTGSVSNAKYIATTHTYASSGIKRAVLTVTDADGFSDRDTVIIDVIGTPTLKDSINASVEDGLRYLYNSQNTGGLWIGYSSYYVSATAQAVLCFENQGYLPSDDPNENIYVECIQQGLDYLTANLRPVAIGLQTYCDPEAVAPGNTDANGLGIYPVSGSPYEAGPIMMALAGSGDAMKTHPAGTGVANVIGRSYYEILVDMVDWCAWAQNESGRGGWRYSANYSSSDNSVSQWPTIGLEAAEKQWGISPPPCVKSELRLWINASQLANGRFTYYPSTYATSYVPMTGAGLCEMSFVGIPTDSGRVKRAMQQLFLGWSDYYGKGFPYAMYGIKKGCDIARPEPIEDLDTTAGYFDWYSDYARYLLAPGRQNATTGQFLIHHGYLGDARIHDHTWCILVLEPVTCVPDAIINSADTVGVSQPFVLDGSASNHPCGEILQWRWDFDVSDGIDFDNPDAIGQVVTHPGVPLPPGDPLGDVTVALRVYDDNDPVQTGDDQKTIVISRGCKAPVAVLGGPYAGHPGDVITFDACASYDPDAEDPDSECPDSIVSFAWDFNGDGIYNDYADSASCTPAHSWPAPTEDYICVEVRDSYGKADSLCVPVKISPIDLDLQPENISFNPATGTEGDLITIRADIFFNSEFDTTIHNVLIRFYDGDPNVLVQQIGPDQILASIDSGQTVVLEVNWTVPDLLPHDIYIVVDPLGTIPEWDESNNRAYRTWVPGQCEEDRLVVIPWVQYEFYARHIGPLTLDSLCLWADDSCTWLQTPITVNPLQSYAWIGNFADPYGPDDVDTATLMINDAVPLHGFAADLVGSPESFPFLDQIFPGQLVLRMRYSIPALVQYYIDSLAALPEPELMWDEAVYPLAVKGQYLDGTAFNLCTDLIIIGHRSGDVNGDDSRTVTDITFLIGYLFRGGPAPDPVYLGDVNHDGQTTVADITRLVGIIFRGE